MGDTASPSVLLFDGDHDNTPQIAKELSRDLDCRVIGVGRSRSSRLFYSRYCDEGVVLPEPGSPGYAPSIRTIVDELRPDVVLPVGFNSTVAVAAVRDSFPAAVSVPLPPSESLDVALDKRRTLSLARRHDVAVPAEYTAEIHDVEEADRGEFDLDEYPFPLFVKSRRETGETTTAMASTPTTFWEQYDDLRSTCDDVIVQQAVDPGGPTYGCGVLFTDEGPELAFSHVERRSVPRRGGTGTRLSAIEIPPIEAQTVKLLDALDWTGIALAEYKYVDGSYVLMEINPKFWASYPLASQCGFRFASTLVADLLDLPRPDVVERATGERTFPLRELSYCLSEPMESVLSGAVAMTCPPARPAFNLEDPFAWLRPPAGVVSNVPHVGPILALVGRFNPLGPSSKMISRRHPISSDRP